MMRNLKIMLAALAVSGALVAGCNRQAADERAAATINDTAATTRDEAAATPPAPDSPVFPLDLTQTSKAGIEVHLSSIQMLASETVVGVKIVNNYSRSAELNRKTYLAGGNGAQFKLRPPTGNDELKVAPSQTLNGELVFEGRPAAGSDAVLVFNEGSNDNPYQAVPAMTFQLPLVQLGYK